jgi:methionyl-tRNA formyltransferase
MKLGLFLVGYKGLKVLKETYGKIDLKFVLSYSDKNTKDESFEQMGKFCAENDIDFYNGKDGSQELYDSVDRIFVIGWQFLLKNNLDKLLVIHDSYLPEHKGWSPTVNYLIEGSPYLAATAFYPTDVMDTGLIQHQKKAFIEYPIKIKNAIEIVSKLYVDIILDICDKDKELTIYEMSNVFNEESFCVWRDKEDYFIDFSDSAEEIKRMVDAVGYPYDGAKIESTYYGDYLIVHDCEVVEKLVISQEKHVGKLFSIEDGIATVICGKNMLKLTNVTLCGQPHVFKKLKMRL